MELARKLKYTGTMVNYYFVCKRKLWLFSHNISFEQDSDVVTLGKLLSEFSYRREDKEIDIDQTIVIDWIDFRNKVIHEVKKSDAIEEAHIWQVKYYLYYLEKKGVSGFKGAINYPKLHKIQQVALSDEDRKTLDNVLEEIKNIVSLENPPTKFKKPICKSCSYFQFCWV